ncbi:hypothetical protein EMCRGX_G019450 [Ephydatia muelleri]
MGNISSRSIASDERQTKVVIRPMLTTAQKNFRTVKDCPTIESCYLPPNTTREELNVPGSRCFLLHSVLTPEECAHYIHETEQVGYEDLTRLFPVEYRSNDRVLSICKPLVECLWRRIEPHLTRREVICIRPVGFGNEGTWRPSRLNECCKFGKYKCGAHFSPHLDGPWVPNEEESSIFTVVIYLNSDFEGGATSFLSEGEKVICSVMPRAGTAVFFNHDTLHEGQPVTQGTKYIIRTEIMFRRVDTEMLPNPTSYQENENYLKTVALYKKSWELEQAGDAQGFTDTYLEGLALQCQSQRTVGKDTSEIFEQVLPYELFMKVFSYLSVQDLCTTSVVCKAWYTMCMDGQLWYQLYMRKWQHVNMEAQSIETTKSFNKLDPVPFTKDWYGKYKQRILANLPHYKKLACVDLGSYCCKFATIENCNSDSIITCSDESVVALVPGMYDFHVRRSRYERYFCGKIAKEKYPKHLINVVQKGIPVREDLLPELIIGCYLDTSTDPKYCPVVILEPPELWNKDVRARVAALFLRQFCSPSVAFLNSAVAILAGLDMNCGIVLDIGREKVTCAAVCRGKLCPNSLSCDHSSATITHLVSMIERTVVECGENPNIKNDLKKHTVICTERQTLFKNIKTNLTKRDKMYFVTQPGDTKYAAVRGGCIHASQVEYYKKFLKDEADQSRLNGFYDTCLGLSCTYCGLYLHSECSSTFSKVSLDVLSVVKRVCTPCPSCETSLKNLPLRVSNLEQKFVEFVAKTEAVIGGSLPAQCGVETGSAVADKALVKEIFDSLSEDSVFLIDAFRLGKEPNGGLNIKPRLVKVRVANAAQRSAVLRKGRADAGI